MEPTERAKLKCKNWLVDCLNNGWRADTLTHLEKLWWEYHDPITGNTRDPETKPLSGGR
jgi:hypothetical protein